MVLLALDTATRTMSLALYDGKTLLSEQMWLAGNQHNTLLSSAVQASFQICGISPKDISAVAVAHGPGSYTGLRIGVALAKGIAAANKIPLIGVSTLDILAVPQPISTKNRLWCVVFAGRGRVIVGTYHTKKGKWQAEDAPIIVDWETLLSQVEQPTLLTGEIDEVGFDLIAKHAHPQLTLVSPANRARRASILAEEAWRRWKDGVAEDFDPAKLVPVYLQSL